MKFFIYLHVLILTIVCTLNSKADDMYSLPENLDLQMVNILFRHGDRTPEVAYGETYPKDPYINETYYPIGYGALTNKGKYRAFKLGMFLRKRYNKFLGDIYIPQDVTARSTNVERTKMTLLLVLAALFPPLDSSEKWHSNLNWQPIPITYEEGENFLQTSSGCPKYRKILQEIRESSTVIEESKKFKTLWDELSKFTGESITRSSQAHTLYNTLISHESMSFHLPNWAKKILIDKEFLKSVALSVHTRNYNDTLKKMNAGTLLRKMTYDMISKKMGNLEKGKKINLYSAHDSNVASHLLALGVTKPHQPYYTSSVILELYCDNEKNYYVQVVHYKGHSEKIKILQIPNCTSNKYNMCKFNDYLKSVEKVIPTEDEMKCT
ncbi:venom acid phosphatase Acph-1-like [Leptopilina boulardi]|uniref:venom acid phosphatase Acph-1-like n=1 Tax=Leptopilina boulardi TaxID=63433 RepID=UPI0021F62BFC|nr:venom acid phosphatase Acph-1-like [Leptopilina boulardi]